MPLDNVKVAPPSETVNVDGVPHGVTSQSDAGSPSPPQALPAASTVAAAAHASSTTHATPLLASSGGIEPYALNDEGVAQRRGGAAYEWRRGVRRAGRVCQSPEVRVESASRTCDLTTDLGGRQMDGTWRHRGHRPDVVQDTSSGHQWGLGAFRTRRILTRTRPGPGCCSLAQHLGAGQIAPRSARTQESPPRALCIAPRVPWLRQWRPLRP